MPARGWGNRASREETLRAHPSTLHLTPLNGFRQAVILDPGALHVGTRTLRTLAAFLPLAAGLCTAVPWALLHAQAQERVPVPNRPAMATVTVEGIVVDQETRSPLQDAAVSLTQGPDRTPGRGTRLTDSVGHFHFDSVPPGSYEIVVALLGYRERRDTLTVEPGDDLTVLVPLSVSPVLLDPIVVEVRRRLVPSFMEGFEQRQTFRSGSFFTREDIEQRSPMYFSDLLRMVPGARVSPSSRYGNVVTLRGGCSPQLWVDGVRTVTSLGLDGILQPMNVEGVEVYHAGQTPAEFGGDPCGTIVVWTRHGEPGPATGSFWTRLVVAVGFITLTFLLTR
jgi:hypothetical protein